MAPKSPLTPSLRVRPEGLPTWSRPEGPDRGLALAGCPSVPRSRRSASRLPARPRPRRPKPPGRSAFDPVPRARFSGSSADRPKVFAASATGFLAVAHRVNELCFAPVGEATKIYGDCLDFRWITKHLRHKFFQFFPQTDPFAADSCGVGLWIKLSPRNFRACEKPSVRMADEASGPVPGPSGSPPLTLRHG